MICEYCKQEHDGSYGSGRFCSAACRSKYARKISSAKGANATKENYKQIRYNKLQLVLQNKADVTILKKKNLKDLLIEFGYKQHICENCKLTTWLNYLIFFIKDSNINVEVILWQKQRKIILKRIQIQRKIIPKRIIMSKRIMKK